eukprot:s406_g16.t1
MATAKVEHADLPQHSLCILQRFRESWIEDHFCDVVLQSSDGAQHRAHAAVLYAASKNFKNLLDGSFLEAGRVQRGQPVEIAASKAAVHGLLDYVYGGKPEVNLEAGLELIGLAEAFGLPKLASAIETGFRASLNSNSALQILQEAHGLHTLKAACEEKVAEDFETCSQQPDFGKLDPGQLAGILDREDLMVSREEVVFKALFNWLKISKDREAFLGALLHYVDFKSISVENLLRLGRLPVPGLNGDHLHRKAKDALQAQCRKRTQSQESFRPKRRCLQHWSPDLGASTEFSGRQVLPTSCLKLCWHEGAIYALDFHNTNEVFCWKPGDPATQVRKLLGEGTRVAGINNLGTDFAFSNLSILPTGEIFLLEHHRRLVGLHNGFGRVVLDDLQGSIMRCSPTGVLYVLTVQGVQKLEGSRLQTVMTFESLPRDLRLSDMFDMFVTKEEVIYILDNRNARILRFNPAESFEPFVVGQVLAEPRPDLLDMFVTEAGTIYVTENGPGKVLAIRPGDTTFTEVLECPGELTPTGVLVQDRSLYVSMLGPAGPGGEGLYEYVLPLELQLECKGGGVEATFGTAARKLRDVVEKRAIAEDLEATLAQIKQVFDVAFSPSVTFMKVVDTYLAGGLLDANAIEVIRLESKQQSRAVERQKKAQKKKEKLEKKQKKAKKSSSSSGSSSDSSSSESSGKKKKKKAKKVKKKGKTKKSKKDKKGKYLRTPGTSPKLGSGAEVMFNFRAVLQQLCCIHRPESTQRPLDRIHLEAAPSLPPNARNLSECFGKVKTRLRIVYISTGPDAERFDAAFQKNDLEVMVELMDSKQAVDALLEPKHPWAEDPRSVGALSAMQLAMLASMVGEDDSSVREDIGRAGAIPPLVRLLQSQEADAMQAAVVALKYLTEESGPNATSAFEAGALPALIQLLKHPVPGLRGVESEDCHEHLATLGGIQVLVGQLDCSELDVKKDHDHDLLLEAVWNLEDLIVHQDGHPLDRFCHLAVEAGAVEKLQKLREVGAGELLLAVEKLMEPLTTFQPSKFPDREPVVTASTSESV